MSKMIAVTAILILCLTSLANSQQPPSPTPNPPETGPDVDLLHGLRRSTVSLGLRANQNGEEIFVTVGSGVIVAWDAHHACLLTAKHVFDNPEKGFHPTMLYMRLPKTEPRAQTDLGVPLTLVANGNVLWRGAQDADLAVTSVPDVSVYKDLHAVFLNDFGGEDDVYQGAAVVVMGYPELLGPDYQTTPIARNGIIAWTNPEGRLDHTFLVDANVFSGNSGGPVFHLPTGVGRTGGFMLGGPPRLIGIVSKDAAEEAPVHAGETPLNLTNQQNGVTIPLTAKVLNIGGIGIVEPISKAKKLIIETFNIK